MEQTSFKVEFLKTSGVLRFTFFNFQRETLDSWATYIRSQGGVYTTPLKVLYDLRLAGFPTPYTNQISVQVMNELQIPPSTRSAYLVATRIHKTYSQLLARRMPKRVGEIRVFLVEAEAIDWSPHHETVTLPLNSNSEPFEKIFLKVTPYLNLSSTLFNAKWDVRQKVSHYV